VGGGWQALVVLDVCWAVGGGGVRYWKGPAASTPSGYEPPTDYDRQRYLERKQKLFALSCSRLAKTDRVATPIDADILGGESGG
jgi:hypothetical protein